MNNILASQKTYDQQMICAITDNEIKQIIKLIPNVTDVNKSIIIGATALSRLCDHAMLIEQKISPANTSLPKSLKIEAQKTYQKTLKAIELLLDRGANPNIVLFYKHNPSPEYTLPFLFKCINNNTLSNENKLNINIQNAKGDTPLHKAVKNDNENLILCLLILGADVTIKNKNGKTAENLAQNPETIKLLFFESVRNLQMPIYKEHKSPRYFVYPHENQEAQKPFYCENLCSQLHDRQLDIKHRLGQ